VRLPTQVGTKEEDDEWDSRQWSSRRLGVMVGDGDWIEEAMLRVVCWFRKYGATGHKQELYPSKIEATFS